MQPDHHGFRFDKTINYGHVLTVISFVIVALTQWNIIDKRVVILEEFRLAQRERDMAQDNIAKDKFQEVRDALIDLRHGVEKVADKLNVK